MRRLITSSIMPRTTVNLNPQVLRELKRLQRKEGRSLGETISVLVAEAIARRAAEEPGAGQDFEWRAQAMGARVELTDKEAVWAVLDAGEHRSRP